jgi:hypothetical protein
MRRDQKMLIGGGDKREERGRRGVWNGLTPGGGASGGIEVAILTQRHTVLYICSKNILYGFKVPSMGQYESFSRKGGKNPFPPIEAE